MINFIAGITIGAAFAPFWIRIYALGKVAYQRFMAKKPD